MIDDRRYFAKEVWDLKSVPAFAVVDEADERISVNLLSHTEAVVLAERLNAWASARPWESTHMSSRYVGSGSHGEQTAEDWLRAENEALRAELERQWHENHFEHCGRTWPHPEGQTCHWPRPKLLDGWLAEFRLNEW